MSMFESDQDISCNYSSGMMSKQHQFLGHIDGKLVYQIRYHDPALDFEFDAQQCSCSQYSINQVTPSYTKVRTRQDVKLIRSSTKPPNFRRNQQINDRCSRKSRLKYHSLDKFNNIQKRYKEQNYQQPCKPIKRNKKFIRNSRKDNKKRRLKIQVIETKIGVVLDLRQLRQSRLDILKKRQKKNTNNNTCTIQKRDYYSNLTPTTFPSLLVLKNHKLASQSVKLFMRQLSQKYSDSLEIIRQERQKKLSWCDPPPPQQQQVLPNLSAWLYENDELISMSDSQTFVDQEDWLMDIESQQHYQDQYVQQCGGLSGQGNLFFDEQQHCSKYQEQISFAENQVLCVQNVQNFSKLIGFNSDYCCGDDGYIDL